MEKIKLKDAEIILEDLGDGKGKIFVASGKYNSSTYWGAMGSDLKTFLLNTNHNYFANRLTTNNTVFSAEKTLKTLRTEWKGRMHWYENMEFQKEMRFQLKYFADFYSEHDFVDWMCAAKEKIDFSLIECEYDRRDAINFFTCEPWHYIEKEESEENKFYREIHKQLKEILK